MKNGYTIKSIFQLLVSKLWLILTMMIVGGGAMFCVSKFMMPLKYQSYTSMYVKNSNETIITDGVNLNDLNASKSLLDTYIAVLQDDAVIEVIGDELLKKHTADELDGIFSVNKEKNKISVESIRSCLTMAAVNETEVLKVTAITKDADISAELCNIIADIAPDFLIRVVGAGSVEAIGEAKPDYDPVSPNVMKFTILGILAGMLIAVIIIFVLDFIDNTVKDSDELSQKYKKAIIGEIPSFSGSRKKSNSDERKTLLDKEFPFYIVESYKAMRTNIVFSLSTSEKKIFAVSSADPGEGKSTTSSNIAIALAQADHKVLLIDADMRKPVQHKIFKVKNKNGLSSVIGKMVTAQQCIHKDVVKNLDLLSAGPKPPNPSELLASEQAEKMMNELSEKYDYIVVDTPPVNVVSDAMGISKSLAGIFLVLKYGETTFDTTEKAMKKIQLADMNMLGFIVNDITGRHHGGYYYRYKDKYGYSGYGYGNEEGDKKEKEKEE
ncbi:MAG: polysaccharide biosynthesis tyrosine autokinase [Ruminococcus sp.]|nr:polysaccharide biosynthesis tyrosine autokinase [Ruminococcus sp.]